MGRQQHRRGTVGKYKYWQKETDLPRTEYCIHIEDQFPQKLCDVSFTNATSTVGCLANAKPLITESNAQLRKRRCHDDKTWTSDNRKRMRDMVR
jgi:hypothetical protein